MARGCLPCVLIAVRCLRNKIHLLSLLLHSLKTCLFWVLHQQSTSPQTKQCWTKPEPQDSHWPWRNYSVSDQFVFFHAQSFTLLLHLCKWSSSLPYGIITGTIRSLLLIHFYPDSHSSWLQTVFTEKLADLSHICLRTFEYPPRSSTLLKNHFHS